MNEHSVTRKSWMKPWQRFKRVFSRFLSSNGVASFELLLPLMLKNRSAFRRDTLSTSDELRLPMPSYRNRLSRAWSCLPPDLVVIFFEPKNQMQDMTYLHASQSLFQILKPFPNEKAHIFSLDHVDTLEHIYNIINTSPLNIFNK